ncbi:MAG: DUF4115 domain-containing protein [Alphaproteobacteria bacterium]|jgi:transcriptional regulator with XRE-family HTH domain|nr:DUF4115 domain-containing protein [Alphaproteobacteria bacterium]
MAERDFRSSRRVDTRGRRGLLPRAGRRRGQSLHVAVPGENDEDGRPPYAGIGVELRLARERRNLSAEEVAAHIRIQQQFVEAIEEGRFDALPGAVYVTGFLKAYATYLNFDPEYVVDQVRQESTMALGPTKLVAPGLVAEPRRPRSMVVMLSLLAAAVLYGGWTFLQSRGGGALNTVSTVPDRLVSLLQIGVEEAADPAGAPDARAVAEPDPRGVAQTEPEPVTEGVPRALPSDTAAGEAAAALEAAREVDPASTADTVPSVDGSGGDTRAEATASPAAPGRTVESASAEDLPPQSPSMATVEVPRAESAAAVPPPPPPAPVAEIDVLSTPPARPAAGVSEGYEPQHFGGDNQGGRVVLRARLDAWVQVQGPRNELLLTRILRAGDTYHAPNRSDLVLTTGNVGGLEIIVDGEPLGPLGSIGEVRRDISLDAEELLAIAAARRR